MRSGDHGLNRDGIDRRIDGALRSYAEPSEAPEARIFLARMMERARVEDSGRRGGWIWGAAVAAGLALMVAAGMVWMMPGPRRAETARTPQAPDAIRSERGVEAEAPVSSRGRHVSGNRVTRVAAPEPLPKLQVFPTPRPLTQEEQMLAAFAQNASPAARHEVIEAQQHAGDPIVIAELKIAPLESGDNQDSNERENKRER